MLLTISIQETKVITIMYIGHLFILQEHINLKWFYGRKQVFTTVYISFNKKTYLPNIPKFTLGLNTRKKQWKT